MAKRTKRLCGIERTRNETIKHSFAGDVTMSPYVKTGGSLSPPRGGPTETWSGQGGPEVDQDGLRRRAGTLLELHSRVMATVSPLGPGLDRAAITSGPAELGGTHRFVADHLLTSGECRQLTDLLQAVGVVGDGYQGKAPLSRHEQFRGLSIGRLVVSVDRGKASREDLRFLLDITDSSRLLVKRQFEVDELYPSFTHLVSRTHVPGLGARRSGWDLSHAVHVDNCTLFTNGTCLPGQGAFIHRHFSAVLYLNSEFSGGEFVFADNTVRRRPSVRVRPRCGRLVGFSAGPENPHGVLAVTGGSRYALAMWYTRTRQQRDEEQMVADLYLQDSTAPEVQLMVAILEKNLEIADKLLKK